MAFERRKSKEVRIGNLTIGGNSPIAVQSMLNIPAHDIEGSVKQAKALEKSRMPDNPRRNTRYGCGEAHPGSQTRQ